jgi:circadian clock protein KaiB
MPRKNPDKYAAPEAETGMAAFKFYFARGSNSSEQALANLNRICRQYYRGHYAIEKIDILREPLRALSDGILLTPTLVRIAPPPVRMIVGDLSDTGTVLTVLGCYPDTTATDPT